MKIFKHALFLCIIVIISSQALADNLKIYSPRVDQGELSVEVNMNYNTDHRSALNNYFSQVAGFEYGVTDYWQTELSGEFEKDNNASDQLTNIKWENILAPWKPGQNWINAALYVELEKGAHSGDPNNFETKILLEKDIQNFVNTANIVASHEFGPNHDTNWNGAFAWRTKYRLNEKFEPGFEYYANFGKLHDIVSYSQQDHIAGPVIQGKFGPVKYDTGVLFGISKAAPDVTYKLNLEYEF